MTDWADDVAYALQQQRRRDRDIGEAELKRNADALRSASKSAAEAAYTAGKANGIRHACKYLKNSGIDKRFLTGLLHAADVMEKSRG